MASGFLRDYTKVANYVNDSYIKSLLDVLKIHVHELILGKLLGAFKSEVASP